MKGGIRRVVVLAAACCAAALSPLNGPAGQSARAESIRDVPLPT